jgi:hypothetical protein
MDIVSEEHGVDQAATGPAEAEPIVSVRGPVKRYRSHEAVAGIDLEVRRGEIFTFLGPNGAGKPVTELRHSLPLGRGRCAAQTATAQVGQISRFSSATAHLDWLGHPSPAPRAPGESTWIEFRQRSFHEGSPFHQGSSPRRAPRGAARLLHPSMVLPSGQPWRRADGQRANIPYGCLGGWSPHLRATRSSECARWASVRLPHLRSRIGSRIRDAEATGT